MEKKTCEGCKYWRFVCGGKSIHEAGEKACHYIIDAKRMREGVYNGPGIRCEWYTKQTGR